MIIYKMQHNKRMQNTKGWQRKRPITRKRKMKKTITAILAIALMAIPASATAHIETWAEYDKRLEKLIAELQNKLPKGEKDDDIPFEMKLTSVEKRGKTIIATMETKGESGFIAMAENMGGVEKFKAMMQRRQVEYALFFQGLQLARLYTLRWRYVDNGKEVCTVDVHKHIIISMINNYGGSDDWPEYIPASLPEELWKKRDDYEKYLKEGGYPPALTAEELHIIREFIKYSNIKRH